LLWRGEVLQRPDSFCEWRDHGFDLRYAFVEGLKWLTGRLITSHCDRSEKQVRDDHHERCLLNLGDDHMVFTAEKFWITYTLRTYSCIRRRPRTVSLWLTDMKWLALWSEHKRL
jgi:hypothetical protein